jgi:endonuclease/exonuclease/phosphatase (EEP) superfamily protein YafD
MTQESDVRRDSKLRRGLWWFCCVFAWAGTLALAVLALLKIFYHDGTHLLIQINSFTRYVYLPAYVALAWSLWMRRWFLATAAVAVVACHIAWLTPDFVRDRRFDRRANSATSAADSRVVRVAFSNLLGSHRSYKPLWREIAAHDPDVVVMAESSSLSVNSFLNYPAFAHFKQPNGPGRSRRGEVVVFSKLPIVHETETFATHRVIRTIDVDVGSGTLRIVGLHAPRPMQRPEYDFYGYWDQVIPMLASPQGPAVIVGDYNATQYSLVHKRLKALGLRSAHEDRGRGYVTTWPNGLWNVPPIRIDHAFLTPEVECVSIREERGTGSDHKPLIVDVRICGATTASE